VPESVAIKFKIVGGRAEAERLEIAAIDDGETFITAEAVRQLPLGTIIADFRRDMEGFYKGQSRAKARQYAKNFGSRRGRTLDDKTLEEVAKVYRAAFKRGDPVQEAVAEAFHVGRSAAAKRIGAARAAGLLGPAVGTKAGEVKKARKR